MLRILVISLFVANLLLLGFQGSKPAVEPETCGRSSRGKRHPVSRPFTSFSEMLQDQGLLSGNRQCFSLGPFHSSEDKDEIRLLFAGGVHADQRAPAPRHWWRRATGCSCRLTRPCWKPIEELISLQALGLEDIGIIYDGEWKNAISLGYFLRQENAVRRKKSLESKGMRL